MTQGQRNGLTQRTRSGQTGFVALLILGPLFAIIALFSLQVLALLEHQQQHRMQELAEVAEQVRLGLVRAQTLGLRLEELVTSWPEIATSEAEPQGFSAVRPERFSEWVLPVLMTQLRAVSQAQSWHSVAGQWYLVVTLNTDQEAAQVGQWLVEATVDGPNLLLWVPDLTHSANAHWVPRQGPALPLASELDMQGHGLWELHEQQATRLVATDLASEQIFSTLWQGEQVQSEQVASAESVVQQLQAGQARVRHSEWRSAQAHQVQVERLTLQQPPIVAGQPQYWQELTRTTEAVGRALHECLYITQHCRTGVAP